MWAKPAFRSDLHRLIHLNVVVAIRAPDTPKNAEAIMRARDIMTTNVLTVTPITPVRDVAQLMVEHRISSVPVVHGSKLVGIITDGDLYRRAELGTEKRHRTWLQMLAFHNERAADYVRVHGRTARDIMTTDVIAVEPTTTLRQIADLFEIKRIRRVPVVADGMVIGIVSRANLVQALATISSEDIQGTATDRQVRALVIAEYKRLPFGLPSEWNVIVKDGIVHLWGFVPSLAELAALRVAAEGVPGVKGFVDLTFGYRSPVGGRESLQSRVTVIEADEAEIERRRHEDRPTR
jgi:CBS domain-containing protein